MLSTAAVFAVGFVMRPVGAWIMGIYADRKGRKAGLSLSVGLMCVGSLMIAAAPILDGNQGGPVRGMVILGRLLSASEVELIGAFPFETVG